MNSWVKHVILTVNAIPVACFDIYRQIILMLKLLLTSLQSISIKFQIYCKCVLKTLQIIFRSPESINVISYSRFRLKVKEIDRIKVFLNSFLKFVRLPDTILRDKTIAVDDFGNIKYLKQDY